MKKLVLYSLFAAVLILSSYSPSAISSMLIDEQAETATMSAEEQFFVELGLEGKMSFAAFEQALAGFEIIEVERAVLTIIDFSLPSTAERFFVIDMENRELLFSSHVSHGRNSGDNYTTSFSNRPGSNQSSLGFFLTDYTYIGANGLSLRLEGLEEGINHNARARAVVIHGADYSDPNLIRSMGRLGRSQGCPALPRELTKPIIETISNGSLVFAYSAQFNEEYLQNSTILRNIL